VDSNVLNIVKQVLNPVVLGLVDNPDAVRIEYLCGSRSMLVEVEACPDDRRHLIGREGRTAQAMRTIMRTLCAKYGMSFELKIIEN